MTRVTAGENRAETHAGQVVDALATPSSAQRDGLLATSFATAKALAPLDSSA